MPNTHTHTHTRMSAYAESQFADRLHFQYLSQGPKTHADFEPQMLPGERLWLVSDDGLFVMDEYGSLIFRPDIHKKRIMVVLPTTYSHIHGQTERKILRVRREAEAESCVDEQGQRHPVNPGVAELFHPTFRHAPSHEMLERYFKLLYHPTVNERVRSLHAARERRRQEREKKERLVQNYLLSSMHGK